MIKLSCDVCGKPIDDLVDGSTAEFSYLNNGYSFATCEICNDCLVKLFPTVSYQGEHNRILERLRGEEE